MTTKAATLMSALPAAPRERLMRFAREVNIPQGTRLFEEGHRADRFWAVRTGCVTLDIHVPGRRSPVIETLGAGQLVGWSWLFAPFVWHLGAEAMTPVRAWEFDAVAARLLCQDDPVLGAAVALWVGQVVSLRLHTTRTRLLDLYGPYGSGPAP
ncbi:Crp/Fnr family transcriptional regulator [Streptomyces sp. NPDC087420]|uniref:Crp/Fnr family transcriptional regulator n=1 Tax=Streptomyces sp. NPDC087420 TaxID=3365785 RepID=UPI0038329DB4